IRWRWKKSSAVFSSLPLSEEIIVPFSGGQSSLLNHILRVPSPPAMNRFSSKILAAAIALVIGGCTSVNVALNADSVPPQSRQKNHTRAVMSAEPPPLAATLPSEQRIQPATTQAASPTTH